MRHHFKINFSRKEVLIMLLCIVTSIFNVSQTLADKDTTAPIMILKGEAEITIKKGETFVDPGVIAYDDSDNFINDNVRRSGVINNKVPGKYYLKYNVMDSSGNRAPSLNRTIIVSNESTPILGLRILSHTAENIGDTEATIRFSTSENTQAAIAYGLVGEYTDFESINRLFNRSSHTQKLENLESGKQYNYLIYVRNSSGKSAYTKGKFTILSDGYIGFKILSDVPTKVSSSGAEIRFEVSDYSQAYIDYGTTTNYGSQTKGEMSYRYKKHEQKISGLKSSTTYFYKIVVTDKNKVQNTKKGSFKTTGGTSSSSFAQIKEKGLPNACYPDSDHYVAEFLYQNPDVCFWQVNTGKKIVTEVKVPTPPSDAIRLPKPSGGNDTHVLRQIIHNNPGKSFVGQGTYKVHNLFIKVKADIYNMPMIPASSSQEGFIVIQADGVRIFSSPIDAQNSNSIYFGYYIDNGADRAVIVKSGFKNLKHTKNRNASAVIIRAADDFHIACNEFINISNKASEKAKYTARANSIWMSGDNTNSTSGGYIVNNYTEELQTYGKLNDAEFFTVQSYKSTSKANPVKIFANRNLNAGKRLTKHQESNAMVLSNHYHWRDKFGPLGERSLYSVHNIHFSDNIFIRNNRVKIEADGRFDNVMKFQQKGKPSPLDNVHYDCNNVEIVDKISSNSNTFSYLIAAGASDVTHNTDGLSKNPGAPTNSSAKNNIFWGSGNVRFYYGFDKGVPRDGGDLDITGNVFWIPFVTRDFK